MPEKRRKKLGLSDDMAKLKKNIDTLAINNESSPPNLHRRAVFLKYMANTISSIFRYVTSFISKNKETPIIGTALQLMALIPSSVATAIDPNKKIAEKVLTILVAIAAFAATIASIVLGSMFAIIASVAVSATFTVMEGGNFIKMLLNRNEASAAYNKKKSFNELVASQQLPNSNEFKELLKIRYVELTYLSSKKGLSPSKKTELLKELDYISLFMEKNKILLGENPNEEAMVLDSLYKKREEKLAALVNTLALITPTSPLKNHLKQIQALQNELVAIDNNIRKICAPLGDLETAKLTADEYLALSATDLSILTLGTLLSSITLVVSIGSLLMPPLFAPILVGIGVGLTTFGLVKLIVEAVDTEIDAQGKEQALAEQKEFILNEALYAYEHSLDARKTFDKDLKNTDEVGKEAKLRDEPEVTVSQDKDLGNFYSPGYFKPPTEKNDPEVEPVSDKTIMPP